MMVAVHALPQSHRNVQRVQLQTLCTTVVWS